MCGLRVTAAADGTLVVHLKWTDTGGGFTLRLKPNGTRISWRCGEDSPWPVEGRTQVVTGQQVWIAVGMGPGCWDYLRIGPLTESAGAEFVVTTSLE